MKSEESPLRPQTFFVFLHAEPIPHLVFFAIRNQLCGEKKNIEALPTTAACHYMSAGTFSECFFCKIEITLIALAEAVTILRLYSATIAFLVC